MLTYPPSREKNSERGSVAFRQEPRFKDSPQPEGLLFSNSAITSHLQELGYPEKSLKSLERCGVSSGFKIIAHCGCETKIISLNYHCNLRTCTQCSKRRQRRVYREYIDFLNSLSYERGRREFAF